MKRPGKTVQIAGPKEESIHIKFFSDDGSVRFRLNDAGPMTIRYAFLPGKEQNVIVELVPTRDSPWRIPKENK